MIDYTVRQTQIRAYLVAILPKINTRLVACANLLSLASSGAIMTTEQRWSVCTQKTLGLPPANFLNHSTATRSQTLC